MALFASIEPYHQEHLNVGGGHELYLEQSGNPNGEPVLALHGGPGGGSSPLLRRFFDPQRYRIVVFDQRGAGQSRPYACTEHNTLAHLVADIERIREHLGIAAWRIMLGGSWGVTLALSYTLAHLTRVHALALRGVFLCRQEDRDWLYTPHGAARFCPDGWQRFVSALPPGPGTPLVRYHAALADNDDGRLAREWAIWEARLSTLVPPERINVGHNARAMAHLESHYFLHDGFLEKPLLPRCERIRCPVEIVHGRYDLVCPPEQAWLLHHRLPDSRLTWVPAAGHSSAQPAVAEALAEAVERLGRITGPHA